jgi:hypothetical protein
VSYCTVTVTGSSKLPVESVATSEELPLPESHSNTRIQKESPVERNWADAPAAGGVSHNSNVTALLTAPAGSVTVRLPERVDAEPPELSIDCCAEE